MFQSLPLAKLNVAEWTDCLSERPQGGGVPFYGLDEVQKRAITAALVRLPDKQPLTELEEIDWRMKSLNCYACHEHNGVGGAETAREVYFGFESKEAVELGRWGHLPPELTGVENRLTDQWLEGLLLGEPEVPKARAYMTARMPRYASERVRPLLRAIVMEREDDVAGKSKTHSPESGPVEMPAWLKSDCLSCHGAGNTPSTHLPGIDLQWADERLQFPYFRSIIHEPQTVRPGIPMAPGLSDDSEAERQIEGLWQYLETLP
ncbi:MAG: hypothetical protein AAF357_12550 [Verrucomicrobiota bacterium]